jgi:hypothetical protein
VNREEKIFIAQQYIKKSTHQQVTLPFIHIRFIHFGDECMVVHIMFILLDPFNIIRDNYADDEFIKFLHRHK